MFFSRAQEGEPILRAREAHIQPPHRNSVTVVAMDLFPEDAPIKPDIRTQPSESLNQLSINQEFADRYLHNKQRDELHRLQDQYDQSGSDESSESEDETEDEDGDELTPNIDAAIFRTLAKIRSKDASLYDSSVNVFEQEEQAAAEAAASKGIASSAQAKKDKSKKLTLQDYQRQRVEELIKTSSDPARDLADATMATKSQPFLDDSHDSLLAPVQEQELLRKQVTQAFHEGVNDDDELFVKRGDSDENTGSSYRTNLLAALGQDADEETIRAAIRSKPEGEPSLKPKKKGPKASALTEEERQEKANEDFLLDFILNQRWIDKEQEHVPSKPKLTKAMLEKRDADEKAAESSQAYGRDWEAEAAELESEASFDSKADAFETAYNFRFEQGESATTIPSFARNPKDSVRREDNKRKVQRQERQARKDEEKQKKMQDLARLKNLKRAEIVDKLKRLKQVTGSSNFDDLDHLDLDKEFDPDQHDQVMTQAFGDDYYGAEDDDEKPTWDDDIEIDDIIAEEEEAQGSKKGKKVAKQAAANDDEDDDRIEMDADFMDGNGPTKVDQLRTQLADAKLSKKDRKKLKKKLKAAEEKAALRRENGDIDMDADAPAVEEDEPVPATAEERKAKAREMLDEYYKLDYEDVIGDQPTRFKYTQVPASTYGMTPVEILLADDADLNNVVGIKHMQPYRRGNARPADLGRRLHEFRTGGKQQHKSNDGADGEDKPKRMGRKERMRKRKAEEQAATATAEADSTPSNKRSKTGE